MQWRSRDQGMLVPLSTWAGFCQKQEQKSMPVRNETESFAHPLEKRRDNRSCHRLSPCSSQSPEQAIEIDEVFVFDIPAGGL